MFEKTAIPKGRTRVSEDSPGGSVLQRKCACGGSSASGECAECKEKEMQRKSLSSGPAVAPPIVHEVLGAPGQALPRATRSLFEPRFGHDFSKVRIHADDQAAQSAQAVNALAYTVGHHVVFGLGQFQPATLPGKQLLAHELAHVVQQKWTAGQPASAGSSSLSVGASDSNAEREADAAARTVDPGWNLAGAAIASRESRPKVQRADDEWSKLYGTHRSFLNKSYEEFKGGLGYMRATSKTGLSKNVGRPIIYESKEGGTPAAPEITLPVLLEIYPALAAEAKADKTNTKMDQAERYRQKLNEAFKIMKIDTVEAQAVYLAHAFKESGQFTKFSEVPTADWTTQYPLGGDVNPQGNYEFRGRGPVQLTHKPEYVEVVAMLEKTAEQYEYEAAVTRSQEMKEFARLARKAAAAVKADPANAADPEYAFLTSAALMKKQGADVAAAGVKPGVAWTGHDAASGWVAGGEQKKGSKQAEALVEKSNAYTDIHRVLMREATKASSATP
jgi:hypothetical protein